MSAKEYNKCVDLYADSLYRFAVKMMKQSEAAKDIVQDSFEKLWTNCRKIEVDKAKSYLFTIAYHAMIDEVRKCKRKAEFILQNPKTESHNYQYSDLNELLHRAVDKLPDIQKSVLLLRDYEGYSYAEIEEITGLNQAQVKVYIYRARLYMKQYIGSLETVV
ncbi:MAG: RNA polymerase sigma factor [Prevotellaceae bacterium]|nr:RNA polymerase sigma factor [Prevotellaceae bacterium]